MALETKPFVFGEGVHTAKDAVAYIHGALAEAGPDYLPMAVRTIAETEGMTALARKAGLTKAGLYRALDENGNPKLSTINAILDALGLQLSVTPKKKEVA